MKSTTPIRDLTAAARAGLTGSWGKSIGLMLVYMLLLAGSANVPVAGGILQLIFAAPLVVGLHTFFLRTIRRQDNPFRLIFAGFDCFGASWCAHALVMLIILAWMLPLGIIAALPIVFMRPDPSVFPGYTQVALAAIVMLAICGWGIILQMRYYLVLYLVADHPSIRARDAVRRSAELMRGNYARLALLWLRFIGWQLLCVLSFGIGFLWLIPYMSAATAAFYDDLAAAGKKSR